MAINIYDTRTMLQAIEKFMPVQTFFRDTFFPLTITFPTEKVDVDFRKGKRKMAPFVARTQGGILVDRQGFRTDTYETPYIAPQRVLTKNDITPRMIGELMYTTRTPEQRAQEILAKDLVDLDDMITRREEWFCRELLLYGKVTIKGWIDKIGGSDYVEDEVDYQFTNKETLTGDHVWNPDKTADKSTKYDDLKRIRLAIVQASGRNPDVVIMAQNVADMFLNDDDILKLLDNRRITIGVVEPKIKQDGITYLGTLTALGLEMYAYNEWFVDDDGAEKPMMPDDYLIMGHTGLGERLYGAVTQIEADEEFYTYEGMRVPKVWADRNNDVKMIRVASRPLPKPDDVDSWYVLKVK